MRFSFPRAGLNQKYRKGKDAAIFVNSCYFLNARERSDLSFSSDHYDDAWQDLWVEINFFFFLSTVIGVIYKNPDRPLPQFRKFMQEFEANHFNHQTQIFHFRRRKH